MNVTRVRETEAPIGVKPSQLLVYTADTMLLF